MTVYFVLALLDLDLILLAMNADKLQVSNVLLRRSKADNLDRAAHDSFLSLSLSFVTVARNGNANAPEAFLCDFL